MKKKIELKDLKVNSFVTSVEESKSQTVKGGNWGGGGLTRGQMVCPETIVPDRLGLCRGFTLQEGCTQDCNF